MIFTAEEKLKLRKFFQDPDWALVQKAVGEKILRLEGLKGIDDKLPAEDVKCQVRAHKLAQSVLKEFFIECDILAPESVASAPKDEDRHFN